MLLSGSQPAFFVEGFFSGFVSVANCNLKAATTFHFAKQESIYSPF